MPGPHKEYTTQHRCATVNSSLTCWSYPTKVTHNIIHKYMQNHIFSFHTICIYICSSKFKLAAQQTYKYALNYSPSSKTTYIYMESFLQASTYTFHSLVPISIIMYNANVYMQTSRYVVLKYRVS